MKIYYVKKSGFVKFINFLNTIMFILILIALTFYLLQRFEIYTDYSEYYSYSLYAAIIIAILWFFLVILAAVINKRKNITFDGQIIQFRVNKTVEHEFDIRKIDEIFNYRSTPHITYGFQDSMAFRFHKNEIWTTINSSLRNLKNNKSSIELIRDVNNAYANIKSQRAIKQMSSDQGVRFKMLSLPMQADRDQYNNALKEFEQTFNSYSNTYGDFITKKIVITNDTIYIDGVKLASINERCYAIAKPFHQQNDNYLVSDTLIFYNKDDEQIGEIDLTLVMNAALFKELALSLFTKIEINDNIEQVEEEK